MRVTRLVPALLLVALLGCGRSDATPPDPDDPPQVQPRSSWVLSHTVRESDGLRVDGGSMSHFDESTSLSLGQDADGLDVTCYVRVSVAGQGGPENMVGEKVPVTVNGRPGVRNGAGAEGPYLMWQHDGRVWTEVSCSDDRPLEPIAEAVVHRPSALRLPFGLSSLPDGYGLSAVTTQGETGDPSVYLGRFRPAFGLPDSDVAITYAFGDAVPTGRGITVQGRPALLGEDRQAPSVCLDEQRRYVCVRAYVSDTGPYPDRRDEIPALIEIAEALRFAPDLDDRSTWLDTAELPS